MVDAFFLVCQICVGVIIVIRCLEIILQIGF